ncbi:MAG: CPBP family glutamic-type intramembrane protease, partial [Planctomycetota bacterium]
AFTGVLDITTRDGRETSAFLRLPREVPIAVVFILIGYPWFSVYPQEVVCRPFFFWRYAAILPRPWQMVAVNSVAFAWIHAPFLHWMALALTLPGGVLFAMTYHRTRSTLAVTIEHGLMGWWAFVVGLGWFVFTGSVAS